jgi:RIO-like serine/threonine protein kinase
MWYQRYNQIFRSPIRNEKVTKKMKFNRNRIEKTVKILERLRYNGLKIPQVIDVFKRFVLPR